MASPRIDRKIAAIMAVDVTGFSALVEQDEAGTLARLATLRAELIQPLLAIHHGRLIKLLGDGFLAELDAIIKGAAA